MINAKIGTFADASMREQVIRGLYVGNEGSAGDKEFLTSNKILTIINLTGKFISAKGITVHEYMLPCQDLMDSEIPKTMTKLDSITSKIKESVTKGAVLICCDDGKNRCMLAAGHYLIDIGNKQDVIISKLETLYLSAEQKLDHATYTRRLQLAVELGVEEPDTNEAFMERKRKQEERRPLQCLTMQTFKKVLRIKGGLKK